MTKATTGKSAAAETVPWLALGVIVLAQMQMAFNVNFLIPLYIQIVQDQTSLFTAVAVVPYTLAIGAAAMLSVRLCSRFTPRVIAVIASSMAPVS